MNATQPLKPFKAQFTLSFHGIDIGCAGKQIRDAEEALEDLGFELETAAFGEPGDPQGGVSVLPTGVAADAPSGGYGYETEVRIVSRPGISGGQPMLLVGCGARVVDLIDRVGGGDRIVEVAEDFGADPEEVVLLVRLAESVTAPRRLPSEGNVV